MERILKKASKTHKQRVEVSKTIPSSSGQLVFIVGLKELLPFGKHKQEPGGLVAQHGDVSTRFLSLSLPQDFNRHLDTLTEHYDIPKVSWTK